MIIGIGLVRINFCGVDVGRSSLVISFFLCNYCELFMFILRIFGVCYVLKLRLGYCFFSLFLVGDG